MFAKVLIANRGEIACRVMRSCRRLGVGTVAVYSDADAQARHVRLADEAVHIGSAEARASYLDGARVLAAAQASGAQAIHPGYGFLSENAEFAQQCADAGVVFIGPPPAAIRAMGSKSAAKTLMAAAGVPVTPGYHGAEQDDALLATQAQAIGYPLLIKAVAGGGGKGMRRVECAEEFADALAACRREAQAAFADARVLLERYVLRPRHVEVQVFADAHGGCIHLYERDCSVQRRHQKVLEEAPAPGLSAPQRGALGAAAVAAARAVGYVGAGTVEFILAPDGAFSFMEMNTRLQVEHPVTEMVTGLDLVEWQLRIAAGERLPLAQEQVELRGHAIEARLYAEDPARGFLPATGRLEHLALPAESLHVRIDSGVAQGDAIGPHYDPMIAKLIVWDDTRERARARLLRALAQVRIAGVANNVEFLSRLAACPAFATADLDTALLEREHDYLLPPAGAPPWEVLVLAALAELLREAEAARALAAAHAEPHSPWHLRDGFRINGAARRTLRLRAAQMEYEIAVRYTVGGYCLEADGRSTLAHGQLDHDGQLRAEFDGRRLSAAVVVAGERRQVFADGRSWQLAAVDPLQHTGGGGGAGGALTAPMPGKVIALLAAPGARVARGAPLLILEAMKMEHTIAAPAAGTVKAHRYAVGEQVSEGAELVEFEGDE